MKKVVAIGISALAIFGLLGVIVAAAAAYPTGVGGTGTTAIPSAGQVMIGTGSGAYTPAYLLCAGTCTVATSSGGITITGTGIANNTGNWAGTWQLFNPSDFLPSSTQKVVSVNGLSGVVTISSSSLGVIWPTVNGNQATNYNLTAGQGATSTVSGATTTISVSLNNGSAVNCSANQFLNSISATGTASCGSITFPTAMTYTFSAGTGISISQASSSTNTTTTITLNINNGSGSTCGGQYANGISATGTVLCGTPSSAGGVATSGVPIAGDVTYFSPDGNTVTGSSSLSYNGTTFTITNSSTTAANTLNIITNVNTGSGASTNGAVFINCSQDTAGLCENINQESSNLSSAQNMLFVNSGSPDNTTVSSTQTLTSTSTTLTVGSTAGFPSSGDLLIQQSTSSSQNANGTILQYTTTTATQFIGTAGSFYQPLNSAFNLVTGDKVYYVDTNDHQVKVEIYQHGINGAATPLKIVGTGNLGLEWTNQGLNNASGSGQFQLDLANSVGQNPTSSDVMRGEGRNDANTAFNPIWAFTRPGLTDEGMFCIGDCNNLVTPQSWKGLLNLFPNSAEGDTNVASLPIVNIQESNLGLTANAFQLKNSSGTIIMSIDGIGNVSTSANFYGGGSVLVRSVTKTVCASNSIDTTNCDYKATGTNDDVTIQNAINAVASSSAAGGHVILSEGTFTVGSTSTITILTSNIWLSGQGQGATRIVSNGTSTPVVQVGTRQSGGGLLTNVVLSAFTAQLGTGTSTIAVVKLDGFGNGSEVHNVTTNFGGYGIQLEDADRVVMQDDIVNNPYTSGMYNVMGLENTWGNVTYLDDTVALSNASTSAWSFEADADQSSPAAFARVTLLNDLLHSNNGVASTTGLLMDVPSRAMTVQNSLFESNTQQIKLDAEDHVTFLGNQMSNNNAFSATSSVDCVAFQNTGSGGGNPVAEFIDSSFGNCVNAFHSYSGFPTLTFTGSNKNDSNITNMFVGSWSSINGTDFQFAGDNVLNLGFSNDRLSHIYSTNVSTQNLTLPSTTVNSFLATNGSGLVVATSAPSGSATTTINSASGPIFNFTTATTTAQTPSITTSTSGASSTVQFTFPVDGAHSITVTTSTQTYTAVVDSTTTPVVVQSTTTFTPVYSYVIPANTLGTNGKFYRITMFGNFLQQSGATAIYMNVALLLNGVQIASTTAGSFSTATGAIGTWKAVFDLSNASGTANNQIGDILVASARGASLPTPTQDSGAGTVDTTSNQTLSIQINNGTTTSNVRATVLSVENELVGATSTVVTGVTYN